MQFGQLFVGNFPVNQRLRYDPDGIATSLENGVREGAHQANTRAAIHQYPFAARDRSPERFRGAYELRISAWARAAEYTHLSHPSYLVCLP